MRTGSPDPYSPSLTRTTLPEFARLISPAAACENAWIAEKASGRPSSRIFALEMLAQSFEAKRITND